MNVILTIAGSDSSGGAGIQADLKTIQAFGCYGASVLTVCTAQNTTGVTDVVPLSPGFVAAQLLAVASDLPIAGVKTGMLLNREIIAVVRDFLRSLDRSVPVVVDPVAVSNAGDPLLEEAAIDAMKTLFPLASVITPNRHEYARFGDLAWPASVIEKNVPEDGERADYLRIPGKEPVRIATPEAPGSQTHGSGCTFSAALASLLGSGVPLEEAARRAKAYVYRAILEAPGLGRGSGPVNHLAKEEA